MQIQDPTLSYLDAPQKNFVMACYTFSLTLNETIYCKTMKSSTVNLYVAHATKLTIFKNKSDPT